MLILVIFIHLKNIRDLKLFVINLIRNFDFLFCEIVYHYFVYNNTYYQCLRTFCFLNFFYYILVILFRKLGYCISILSIFILHNLSTILSISNAILSTFFYQFICLKIMASLLSYIILYVDSIIVICQYYIIIITVINIVKVYIG